MARLRAAAAFFLRRTLGLSYDSAPSQFGEDAGLLDLLFEPPQRLLQRFVVLEFYHRQGTGSSSARPSAVPRQGLGGSAPAPQSRF